MDLIINEINFSYNPLTYELVRKLLIFNKEFTVYIGTLISLIYKILIMKKEFLEAKISIIKEVANAITAINNLDSITNLILDLALNYTNARSGSIFLLDNNGELVISASKGIAPELKQTIRVKVGEYICGKVAKERTPLLVKDIESDGQVRSRKKRRYKTKSFICCPIVMKDKLLGVININDKTDGDIFREDELDLINILASQTAISLEHARLISALSTKAGELDERNKGLIDSDRLKTEFIAKMTHELRTPLNSIKGAVYFLKDKTPSQAEQKEFINIISDETDKLISHLDGLLNFSRLEQEEITFKRSIINIKNMLEEAISARIVRDAINQNQITVNLTFPDSLTEITGEKIRLLQSFIHIIDGSTKYTNPGDTIEIKVNNKETSIEIDVLIKGRTIPEDELPLFFDERSIWYDFDSYKNKMKLFLAKKTFELHKGVVSIFNTPQGFTLQVALPKSREDYLDAEIDMLSDLFLSLTAETMDISRCSLMLYDKQSDSLIIRSAIGIDEKTIINARLNIGDNIAGRVFTENKPMLIDNIETDPRTKKKNGPQYVTRSLLCLPIHAHGKTIGVINLNNKTNGEKFYERDMYFASVITERISYMIGKALKGDMRNEEFKLITRGIEALSRAERDYKKKNGKTTELVFEIMKKMGQSEKDTRLAMLASKFYDIGLTQIDESILSKSNGLNEIDRKIIRTHPFPGAKLIESMQPDDALREIILHHHERYDGTGYPDGLKGKDIPFISRVISVVDSYTAMISDRPYRKAMNKKKSLQQITAGAGSQYDPEVVKSFTQIV